MKKTILLSSIFAIGATFADITVPATTVGVMGIAMPSSVQLVAVPFLGWNADEITINDMINTAELNVGSKLYAPSGENQYNIWQLNEGESGSKVWTKLAKDIVIDATGTSKDVTPPDAYDATMSRGGAYWLEPSGAKTSDLFFLLGKPTDEDGSSSLETGWNLIGNTSGEAKGFPGNGVKDEIICIPNGSGGLSRYTYVSRGLIVGWVKTGERVITTDTIQPGQGIWYFSKTSKSITW